MSTKRNVAILLFDDVEVLDFAGPFEVFNVASEMNDPAPFNTYTVAEKSPVTARGGLSLNAHYLIDDMPKPDILIVPGGWGTRAQLKNEPIINWLVDQHYEVEHLLSVCTGSLMLAQAGLLDGLKATTHHTAIGELRRLAPDAVIMDAKRYTDNGKVVTAGGISAGIDMSLYMVNKLAGKQVLRNTLKEMEYEWSPATHAIIIE